jgi:hypothetical protein
MGVLCIATSSDSTSPLAMTPMDFKPRGFEKEFLVSNPAFSCPKNRLV